MMNLKIHKKIRKYRNGVAHPKKYYNRDNIDFKMLILINFIRTYQYV